MPSITVEMEDRAVEIPATWEICGRCQGEGSSSAHLGAITQDDWENDWSPDEQDDYLNGAYDKPCGICAGSGKVLEPARARCNTDELRVALAIYDDDLRTKAEEESCYRRESGDWLNYF